MRTISFIVAMLLCMIPQAKAQDVDFTYESVTDGETHKNEVKK